MFPDDYYSFLKINRNSENFDRILQQQYLILAKRWHPDSKKKDLSISDEERRVKWLKLSQAYQILSDPKLRKEYEIHYN